MAGLSQTVLMAVAALGGAASVREIAERCGLDSLTVARPCGTLAYRKLIERTARGYYAVTASGRQFLAAKREVKPGPCGPFTGLKKSKGDSLRDRLWTALRGLRKASIPDLLQLAARGDEENALKAVVDLLVEETVKDI